ncbi:Methyltransferase domain/ubiE/COQ5 methyltransferase family [Novymonas esmeraldas]|uniref:Methyltransferase domain/ubiE/COQ5 methyltransferase family n=1 Tax=Novymonas esmeraldas TaxID=1808958 RepID=A0AAW0F1Q2_9TRYP
MRLLSKIIAGTTCVTIFCGSAYAAAITLAPPPNYTVSNNDRLRSYDKLSIDNLYEKKTKSQEFYLGLSRWRRKMLREEGVLRGRVLEVGAGCAGNYAYYPHEYFSDDPEVQRHLKHMLEHNGGSPATGGGDNSTSYMLQHMEKENPCDEIVLCDRSSGMVQSCVAKIQSRLGYTPYRYPDYNIAGIRDAIETRLRSEHDAKRAGSEAPEKTAVRKRKVVHEDGTVQEVLATPLSGTEEEEFLAATAAPTGTLTDAVLVPVLQALDAGDKLPLLSKDGEAALAQREREMQARAVFRRRVQAELQREESEISEKRGRSGDAAREVSSAQKMAPVLAPAELRGGSSGVERQPLFAVANYAAEQLPFPDNSFDTVVDMFGLCSFDDPVRALRELSRVCKPGGKLLLIEHGKGHTPRVNNHLDKWAPRHAKNWGCWWNRDIRRAVRLSGLSVEKWESKHFGTSHYIVARPYKSMEEWDRFELERQQHSKKTGV